MIYSSQHCYKEHYSLVINVASKSTLGEGRRKIYWKRSPFLGIFFFNSLFIIGSDILLSSLERTPSNTMAIYNKNFKRIKFKLLAMASITFIY